MPSEAAWPRPGRKPGREPPAYARRRRPASPAKPASATAISGSEAGSGTAVVAGANTAMQPFMQYGFDFPTASGLVATNTSFETGSTATE